jgi:hypothetical protein
MALPTDAVARKAIPLYSGFLAYFPSAIVAVAALSAKGNIQHDNGPDLRWDRSKSADEMDALVRHLLQIGAVDSDGVLHSVKVAWRALAIAQKELEGMGAPIAPGAVNAPFPTPETTEVLFDVDPKLAAQLELADEEAPTGHLKAGEAYDAHPGVIDVTRFGLNLPSGDEE